MSEGQLIDELPLLSAETVSGVAPAHIAAAAREVHARLAGGPADAELSDCKLVVVAPKRYLKGHPFWDQVEWEPDYACPPTFLHVHCVDGGATAELRQRPRACWWVHLLFIAAGIAVIVAIPHGNSLFESILGGLFFGGMFVLWPAYGLWQEWRGRRLDPGFLLATWKRAIELSKQVPASKLPPPELYKTPPPDHIYGWWEKCARRGIRIRCASGAWMDKRRLVRVARSGGYKVYHGEGREADALIVTLDDDVAATYKGEWCAVPNARLVVTFGESAPCAELWIKEMPIVLAACLLIIIGVGARSLWFCRSDGLLGLIPISVGLLGISYVIWRTRRLLREGRQLWGIWRQVCGEGTLSAEVSSE